MPICSAQKHVNPATGKSVWIFGDIHCDIEPTGQVAQLQQFLLIEAAAQKNALVIAENVDMPRYNPYFWGAFILFDIVMAAVFLNAQNYIGAGLMAILAVMHGMQSVQQLSAERAKELKPNFTITGYLDLLKKQYNQDFSLLLLRFSPLFSLVQRCKAKGVPAIDVEFRFHMQSADLEDARKLAPFLAQLQYVIAQFNRWITRKVTGNKVLYTLTLQDYCDVNDAILREIAAYQTDVVAQKFFQKCVDTYNSSYITQELRAYAAVNPHASLAHVRPYLVQKYPDKEVATVIRDFTEHNKELLDARVIHAIIQNQTQANLFVCLGADHVGRIATVVEALGYDVVSSHGKDNFKALEDNGVIGKNSIQVKYLDYFLFDLETFFSENL